jgi:hypothetical protein
MKTVNIFTSFTTEIILVLKKVESFYLKKEYKKIIDFSLVKNFFIKKIL